MFCRSRNWARQWATRRFSRSVVHRIDYGHRPIDLDPSLQALLNDVDMTLMKNKTHEPIVRRELQVLPGEFPPLEPEVQEEPMGRKSPAAAYGSDRLGQLPLPIELQKSINALIAEMDRVTLREDSKRLFSDSASGDDENGWNTNFDNRYRTQYQAHKHAERDATAFATIALPAHFSAIYTVFHHMKKRLGLELHIERIIDWGSGAGTGIWASAYAFQKLSAEREEHPYVELKGSSLVTYTAIDKRDGLINIAKRLLRDNDLGGLSVSFQKSFKKEDGCPRLDGGDTIALSAFMLSSLTTPAARKELVKEIWESGAEFIVLIDHSTHDGFDAIAEARRRMLKMGLKETDDPDMQVKLRGAHVVAPCPHDKACPLNHAGSKRLVCGFSQRLERPSFIRKTKHSGVGHEDIGYSYVVIRRGPRPAAAVTNLGRIGEVGIRAVEKQIQKSKEVPNSGQPIEELSLKSRLGNLTSPGLAIHNDLKSTLSTPERTVPSELEDTFRAEAYSWPRLVFPPLKASGHIILDACTSEGKIMRLTIPKSQGKQAFYDARKSSWGDIFPHQPKNKAQERYVPQTYLRDPVPVKGEDIGKRKGKERPSKRDDRSYEAIAEEIKVSRKKLRQARMPKYSNIPGTPAESLEETY